MHNPFAEMKEPLPPELKRTLAFWRCSSHCGVGSKLYFSLNCLSGGLLNNHIPSSPNARPLRATNKIDKEAAERILRICQHNRAAKRDKLAPRCANESRNGSGAKKHERN